MKNKKKYPVAVFFAFVLVVPFLVLSALSHYEPFYVSDRGLLLVTPLLAVALTIIYFFYYRRTGKVWIKVRKPEKSGHALLWVCAGTFIISFLLLAAFIRFDLLPISEAALWIVSVVMALITAAAYGVVLRRHNHVRSTE